MTVKEHELRLKINAAEAEAGSKRFSAAVQAVRQAVQALERDTSGAFKSLNKVDVRRLTDSEAAIRRTGTAVGGLTAALSTTSTAATKAGTASERAALAASMALRQATTSAQKLAFRLGDLGRTDGVDRLDAAVDRLHASLSRAPDVAGVRRARNEYENLRVELTQTATAAEYAKGDLAQLAREQAEAARAATSHADALQRLRAAHDPLYASSQRYAAALREIDQLVASNTVGEAQATAMRERAAQTYLSLGAAADASGAAMSRNSTDTMQGVMAGQQLYDVLIMSQQGFQSVGVIAMQQGSQLAAQMNTIKASGGSVFKTLVGGFTSLLNPLSLLTIGGTAAVAWLAMWAFSAGEAEDRAKSFKDALDEVSAATERFATATQAANAPAREIIESYGSASTTIREFLAALAEGEQLKMLSAVSTTIAGLKDEFLELREYATGNFLEPAQSVLVFKDAAVAAGDATGKLRLALTALATAKGPEAQYAAALALKRALDEAGKANGGLNAEQRVLYDRVVAVGAELGNVIGATDAATSATLGWQSAMSGVRAEINAILSALSALGGSVITNAGKRAELTALQAGQTVRQAEVARLRFQHEQEMSAREMGAGDGVSGWINRRIIDASRFQFEEGIRLDDALNAERSAARKRETSTTGGGGGGGRSRTEALTEEQKATEELTKSLRDRADSLAAEGLALKLVASGQFQTEEGARAMAEAMVQSGGAVDSATAALIGQIDAAAALNEELERLARDPVKEWMDSVPDWQTAAKSIQASMTETFSTTLADFLKTGEFDATAFADALFAPVFDAVAQKATKELFTALGATDGSLFGGLFESLGLASMGDPEMVAGSQQAGATIATSMVQAGGQVAAQIQAAMTGAGASAGAAVRAGGQQGLALGANNIRLAASTGGNALGQGVVAGAQQGAPILAQGVAAGAAGGGAGGGILSSLGGWGGIAGMVLGAFKEGGMSTSPVGFASAPAAAFRHAPHYSQGVANTSGIPAILHDNEAVIPLSRGRKIGVELNGDAAGGGNVINMPQTFHIQTNDADSFRKSQKQVAADMASAGQRAVRQNR